MVFGQVENSKFNRIYYVWKRNNWMLDPGSYFGNFSEVRIEGPIFLIGNQGDGLTLLSRMLRRHPLVVSATGNSEYWAGADEMQNVYEPLLPFELSGIRLRAPKHPTLTPPRSWSYACNALIDKYRRTDQDANEYLSRKLKHIIGFAITTYGKNIEKPRFVDKSQVYSVRVSFINKLLEGCNPFFIHVTRNPYATIYRAACGKAGDMNRYKKFMNLDERFQICLEHWTNTAKCIEADKNKVQNYMRIKFEELLSHPVRVLTSICKFVDLEYSDDMIPQAHHKLPFGVRFKYERWYPLRTDVNEAYLKKISQKYVDMIYQQCRKYTELYGYDKPQRYDT